MQSKSAEFLHAEASAAARPLADGLNAAAVTHSPGRTLSIAFFLHTLDIGGLQLSLLRLATQLHRLGFRICIVVQQAGGELASRVPPGIEIISIESPRTLLTLVPLVRFLRRYKPDVLFSGLIHGNLAAVAAARLAGGVKTLLTEHAPPRSLIAANAANWRFRVLPPLIRLLYPQSDALVAVSRGVREELQSMLPAGIGVDLIYNPVVPDDIQTLSTMAVDSPWPSAPDVPYIIGVGRLSAEKRFDVLIRAFAAVAAERPLHLLILGEGAERQHLQALIAELGLQDKVRMPGYTGNPFPYMRSARMLAVTSEFEGFCNVLVEAMACGTPVISSDCPFGPNEILQGGRYGRLVAIGDLAATTEAIRSTLDSGVHAGLLERARQFSVEASAEAYADLVRRLVLPAQGAAGAARALKDRAAISGKQEMTTTTMEGTAGLLQEAAWSGRKLKLAIYLPDLAGGGVERMRLGMLPVLRKRGADVTLLLHSRRGDLLPQLPADARVIGFETRRTLSDLIPLVRYLRREKPDVLLVSLDHNNIVALMAKALALSRTRVVICQHNALSSEVAEHGGKYRVVPFFYRWLTPIAHGVVAVSRGVADDLARSCRIPRERITVIYNPVITERFHEQLNQPLQHHWLDDPSVPVFITVGRLVAQKDHETVLKALSIYRRRGPARLIVLGVGPLRQSLERRARELGIAGDVEFAGFQENPLPWIKRATAMILGSRFEGFGNVIVEALGCGTPVISTNCPFGPDEILDNGRYGHLVPVGDAEAMAAAMAPDLRRTWPAEILQQRAQTFTVNGTVSQYLDLFDRPMKPKGA